MNRNLAVVTGDSSGLGRAVSQILLENQWDVLGLSRRGGGFPQESYQHLSVDLSQCLQSEKSIIKVLVAAKEKGYETVALVNNAGTIQPVKGIKGASLKDLTHALNLNLMTPTWLMGQVSEIFSDSQLRIVNVSSGAASKAYQGWGAYCSTKAGLRMASQVFALENPGSKILSYAPGVVNTPMQTELRESERSDFPNIDRFKSLYEDGQLIDPDLPAKEIFDFLVADELGENYQEYRYGDRA